MPQPQVRNVISQLETIAQTTNSNTKYMEAINTIKGLFNLFGVVGRAELHLPSEKRSIQARMYVGEINKKTHPHFYGKNGKNTIAQANEAIANYCN